MKWILLFGVFWWGFFLPDFFGITMSAIIKKPVNIPLQASILLGLSSAAIVAYFLWR